MLVLVVNAGSSSLKYQLISVPDDKVLAKGVCEKVGESGSFHRYGLGNDHRDDVEIATHKQAMGHVINSLLEGLASCIDELSDISVVGHRIVSGGDFFSESVIIDDDVVDKIELCSELAPLHNPGALMGIEACQKIMPDIPQVAVFDSAFLLTMPPYVYTYALPMRYYEEYHIRKFGAHGTSHRYVALRTAELLDKPLEQLRIITCHIGNGASISAVKYGKVLDTSMGFTPLDGLMMGTRCGNIDPAVVSFIMRKEGLSPDEMDELMNKKSGLLGVSGVGNDMRDVEAAAQQGNECARLALEMYAYSIRKYIGQYFFEMAGADAIVLTAGIGENDVALRTRVFAGLEPLGIILDEEQAKVSGVEKRISAPESTTEILVVPTNEELMIARDAYTLVS